MSVSNFSFAGMLAGSAAPLAANQRDRRSRPREPDSIYGHIRQVLAAHPERALRACEIRQRLSRRGVRLSHEAVSQKLHKMQGRRQVLRVSVPGEWFSRWQVLS